MSFDATKVNLFYGAYQLAIDSGGQITVKIDPNANVKVSGGVAHAAGGAIGTFAGLPIMGHDYVSTAYIVKVDSNGYLSVNITSIPAVDISDDYTRQLGRVGLVNPASGAVAAVNQPDWSDPIGLAVTVGYDSVGQTGMLRTDSAGRLLVTLVSSGTDTERALSLAASTANIGDVDVLSLPALPSGTNYIGKARLTDGTTDTTVSANNSLHVIFHDASGNLELLKQSTPHSGSPLGIPVFGHDGTNGLLLKTDANGELQVDVLTLPSIPAGTNNIGDVDVLTLPALPAGANQIGTIKSIDTSVTPGTAAANLGKAEDAVHASGDTGVMVLAVRRDTAGNSAANGDYHTFGIDSLGRLWVSGTFLEDAASASGDQGYSILGVRRDDPPANASVSADGDYTNLALNNKGQAWVAVDHYYYSKAFTAVAADTAVDITKYPKAVWALQVVLNTGSMTAWQVDLEGSLDNANWFAILSFKNPTNTLGNIVWTEANRRPIRYIRLNCISFTGSSSPQITAHILGQAI